MELNCLDSAKIILNSLIFKEIDFNDIHMNYESLQFGQISEKLKNGIKIQINCKSIEHQDHKQKETPPESSRLVSKIKRKKRNNQETEDIPPKKLKMEIKEIPIVLPDTDKECRLEDDDDDEFIINIPQQYVEKSLSESDEEFIITIPQNITHNKGVYSRALVWLYYFVKYVLGVEIVADVLNNRESITQIPIDTDITPQIFIDFGRKMPWP